MNDPRTTACSSDGEAARLAALYACAALDTAPEEAYDDITRLAAALCGTPIAAVSLVDADRQFFKSIIGLDVRETPRAASFCAHAIQRPDAVMVVPDAALDDRFAANPLVTGHPHIRFYAGAPLLTEDGHALGSLCVIDRTPRHLTAEQTAALRVLARLVTTQLELARRVSAQERLVAAQERLLAAREQAEAENDRLAAIVASSADAIWSADLTGRITSWNAGAGRLYGYPAAEMIGQSLTLLLSPGEEGFLAEIIAALQRGEARENLEVRRRRKDGVWLDVLTTYSPVRDSAGCMAGVSAHARDITAQKQSEAALAREREFTAALLESLQEGIVACDADGRLTLFNRATREMHGLPSVPIPPEEWAAHFDLYRADGLTPLPLAEIPLFRALSGETVREAEMVIAPRDSPLRTVLANGQAIYGADGVKLGAVIAMHDVTEARRIERELTRLAAIVESSEEAILASTLDGTLVSWNAGATRLYGYTAAEVIGRHASMLAPETERRLVPDVLARILQNEVVAPLEVVRTRKDGVQIKVSLSFSPIRDTAGVMIGLSCIARDITARKQAEAALAQSAAALAESEMRLRRLTDAAFEGIAVTQDGIVMDVNPAFAELFGWADVAEMAGIVATQLAAPESRALAQQKVADNDELPYEATLQRRDGSTFLAELRGRRTWLGGRPARVTAVRDITERKQAEAALRESQRFAQSIADHSASIIFVFDLDTRTNIYANRNVAEFLGYSAAQTQALGDGLLPAMLHPDDLGRVLDHFDDFAGQADGEVREMEYRAHHADGSWRWIWSREVVFRRHADGTPWQIMGTAQDISERKALEGTLRENAERLARSEASLRTVLESLPVILYAADAAGIVTLSEGTGLAALGLKPGETVGRSVFDFQDDPQTESYTRRALAGEAISYDAQVFGLWLHVELRPVRDADGAPDGLIGVCFDITERMRSEERFRVLFEQSSDAHMLVGAGGIIDCNPAAVALLRGPDKAALLGLHPSVFSPERQPDGRLSQDSGPEMEALARKNGSHRFEWLHRRLDGEEFPAEITLTPVTLADQPAILAVWHDLTERKRAEDAIRDYTIILAYQKDELERANAELESLATTDGLTGLKNHRTFQERLAEEVSRTARYGPPLSLVLLDVDHFKQYNDTFGHPAGDAVLRRVAHILQERARGTDLVARYGGEEFVLLLPQTDQAGAAIIAERIRVAISAGDWPLRPVTVSLGVASLSLGAESGRDLVAAADAALYRAKRAGRDQVALAWAEEAVAV